MESEAYEGTMRWFGRRWDAPAWEGCPEVPVPAGEECGYCGEQIAADDAGVTFPSLGRTADRVAFHTACFLRSVGVPAPQDG